MQKGFMRMVRVWAGGGLVAASMPLWAATYTWNGPEGGALDDPAHWRVNGMAVAQAPGAGDRIAVPAGVKFSAGASDAAWLANLGGADVAGELEVRNLTAALELPATFTLAGDGRVTVRDTQKKGVTLLGDHSAFTGLFHFTNSVVHVKHVRALGLQNRVEAHAGSLLNDNFVHLYAPGTYNQSFLLDGGSGYFGCVVHGVEVTFAGAITCTAHTASKFARISASGAKAKVTISGGLKSIQGQLDFNGLVWLTGDGASYGAGVNGFDCDNGEIHLDTVFQPSRVPLLSIRGNNNSKLVFERANALNGLTLKHGAAGIVNLNGYDQTMGGLNYTAASGQEGRIHSETPAVLTLTGAATNNRFGGYLTGAVSFALNAPGTTLVMTNHPAKPSTTTGSLTVQAGTLKLGAFAAYTDLSKLIVSGGTLSVQAGASVNRSAALEMSGDGTLEVASGATLNVLTATIDGTAVAAGTYSAAAPGAFGERLAGGGTVQVLSMEDPNLPPRTCTWTGTDQDDLALPFNWTVAGELATMAPKAGDRIVIPAGKRVRVEAARADWLASLTGADVAGELEMANFVSAFSLPATFTLAGDGRVTVRDMQRANVKLLGDHSAFTGLFHFTNSLVSVHHVRALGIQNRVEAHAGDLDLGFFVIRAAGTYHNPMLLDGGNGYNAYLVEGVAVTNTGLMTCTTVGSGKYSRIAAGNGGRVVLQGGVQSVHGNLVYNGDVWLTAGTYAGANGFLCDAGTLHLATALSPETLSRLELRGQGQAVFHRENALNGVALVFGTTTTVSVDLNGFDQTTGAITYNAASGSEATIHSASPAALTLTGAVPSGCFGGCFTGAASFVLDAPGTTLAMTNHPAKPSTTTGSLTVRAGTLTLGTSAAWPALSDLSVAGGTLSVQAGASVNPNVRLRLSSGMLAVAAGAELTVLTARVDGRVVPAGRYTAAAPGVFAGFLSGEGSVSVQSEREPLADPVVYTWTGAAGDGVLTTPGNWAAGAAPTFAGDDVLHFDQAAGTLHLDRTLDVYALVFDGTGELVVTGAPDACLLVGFGGVTVTNSRAETAYAVTLRPSLSVLTDQAWSVASNHTLRLSAELTAAETLSEANTLTIRGAGTLDLQADNSAFLPAIVLSDRLQVHVCANGGLGSPSRALTVRALPYFYGGVALTNDVPLTIYETTYRYNDYTMNARDTPFVQRGALLFANPNSNTGYAAWKNAARIEGGIGELAATSKSLWLQAWETDAVVTFAGEPMTVACNVLTLDNSGTFVFETPYVNCNILCINKCVLRCAQANVLPPAGVLRFSRTGQSPFSHAVFGAEFGILDLNGYDQTVASFACAWDRNPAYEHAYAYVTSAVPASVTATAEGTVAESLSVRFCGAAGFEQAGAGSVTAFSNAVSQTTGTLRVSAGELRLDNGFVWNGSNTVEAVGGLLRVKATGDTVFGGAVSRTKMQVSPYARVALPDGETVTVHKLAFDGKPVPAGLYGPAGAPGADPRYAAYFEAGTGVLRARSSDAGGCCLIFR